MLELAWIETLGKESVLDKQSGFLYMGKRQIRDWSSLEV